MQITEKKITEIKPYEKNPRKNEGAVEYVANSIKEFGFKVPIVIDSNGVIVAGHTRYIAAKSLGMKSVPCVIADDLTDEQIKAFRLADNKTAEMSEWDFDLLNDELDGIFDIDMSVFGFENIFEENEQQSSKESENIYTEERSVPQYTPSGDYVSLADCLDKTKTDELIEEINRANIKEDEKEFLRLAAMRHLDFTYKKIADYYATASAEMQELMEKSALVIIDFNDAIKNGYAEARGRIRKLLDEE